MCHVLLYSLIPTQTSPPMQANWDANLGISTSMLSVLLSMKVTGLKKIRGYANILLQKPSLLLKLNWSNPITKLIKNLLSNTFLQKWNNFEPTKYKEKIKFESIVCHYWLAYNIFSDPWPKQCNRSCSYFKSYGSPACCAYLGKGLTWTEAQSSCQALGGRLPEVYDALDNDRILAIRVLLLTYFFSFIILPNLT